MALTIGTFKDRKRRGALVELPESGSDAAVTEKFGIVGVSGSGKTHLATVVAEEFIEHHIPVVIIDPEGAFWGLQSSKDGSSAGFKVVVLGGREGNLPLEPGAGALIADVFMQTKQPLVLDLSNFEDDEEQAAFVAAFMVRLYAKNREPVHVVIDECDKFCPQVWEKWQRPALRAIKNVVQRGRLHGIGSTLISQRPAMVHKDVLSQIRCLFAFACPLPLDQDAIERWMVSRAGLPKEDREHFMKSLAALPRGTAWAWSPAWLKWLDQITVRDRHTYDSSKTPEIGEASRTPAKPFIDLEALRAAMAAMAERLKEEDPDAQLPDESKHERVRDLRRQITELKQQLARGAEHVVEIPALTAAQTGELERLRESMPVIELQVQTLQETLDRTLTELAQMVTVIDRLSVAPRLRHEVEVPARTSAPKSQKTNAEKPKPEKLKTERTPVDGAEPKLKRGERAMLDTLKAFGGRLSRTQLGTMVRIRPKGTTMGVYLSTLRRNGLIVDVDDETVELTRQGRQRAKKVPVITAGELTQMWSSRLKAGERKLLDAIIRSGARGIDKTSLAKMANIDEEGTTLGVYLSTLRRNSLVREISKRFYPGDALSLAQSQASEAS